MQTRWPGLSFRGEPRPIANIPSEAIIVHVNGT